MIGGRVLHRKKRGHHGHTSRKKVSVSQKFGVLDSYTYTANEVKVSVVIERLESEFVPHYRTSLHALSPTTQLVLERIRQELINTLELGPIDVAERKDPLGMDPQMKETIARLVKKYFPDTDEKTLAFFAAMVLQRSFGLGEMEALMHDNNLEEVAVNGASEPVWVYHRSWGWLKTNIQIQSEEKIRQYATMIGRKVGRQLNILEPLMDANMDTGDRVNATLAPLSTQGNTITLRKFASKPWTITDMIANKTITVEAAALIWEAIQYELSILIAGGTATGKTSFLNSLSALFPPNQRIITIEDTRELQLPKFLQWIPMVTRLANQEGKGSVEMLDLLVNSLRMRPDRIIVGEIRRKREAEVLFEAIHTGHSVYATVHANNAQETVTRLTNPPIDLPKTMLPALSMIVVQYRNRRSGIRRTFQIAEITKDADPNVLMQYDLIHDRMRQMHKSTSLLQTLHLYTGISPKELRRHLKEKESILNLLVQKKVNDVDAVGQVMAKYYTGGADAVRKFLA